MTAALEGYIRRRPCEWLWGHNRWKRSPLPSDRVLGAVAAARS
jgi:lauroyl/myristoyl acyltransferase